MQWNSLLLVSALAMCGLTTEFIDACARELGSKRLRLSLPWEGSQYDSLVGSTKNPLIKPPNWVECPVQLFNQKEAVSLPARLDRFNAKVHLSEVSWVASEDKKLNAALQCWRAIVLDSTSG